MNSMTQPDQPQKAAHGFERGRVVNLRGSADPSSLGVIMARVLDEGGQMFQETTDLPEPDTTPVEPETEEHE